MSEKSMTCFKRGTPAWFHTADNFVHLSKIASLLIERKDEIYADGLNFIVTKVHFALVRSVVLFP